MFDEKYNNAMKILKSEIKLTHEIFLDALEMAKKTEDTKDRKEILHFANDCCCQLKALNELKTKLYKEIGS